MLSESFKTSDNLLISYVVVVYTSKTG